MEASIERLSSAFDPQTRKIQVDLLVQKGLPRMRGGLQAELPLIVKDPSGAVLVPAPAVQHRYDEYWLTRDTGEQVTVVLLGEGPKATLRVRSESVKPGDTFRIQPEG